ncbi:hypothetical protein [Sphingobacterium zeae]|uniref:Uracil DNA glycosylase superfamily protein n=1 Tax=Sphingobacterium zeae TaxID=1776859 RepID=A0ABU0UBQ4_9SPHI|nr:hypothetical protein [Sphingobacterium zeae]MDQ1152291.1 hypothetical protein [Sphingobacterium zeae]
MSNLITDNPVALQALMDETIFGNGFDFQGDISAHPMPEENSTHVEAVVQVPSEMKDTSYVAVGLGAEKAAVAIESGRDGNTVNHLEVLGGEFIYQGSKEQGILFILRYEQYPYFSPAALDAFEKTIGALKLTKETVAVLNLANSHNPNDFKRIMQFFKPTKIILLGVEPASLKLPFIAHNSYMKGRIATVFNTFSFEEMFADVNKKKLFWNEFKTFIGS